jgi:hypothetical protein
MKFHIQTTFIPQIGVMIVGLCLLKNKKEANA